MNLFANLAANLFVNKDTLIKVLKTSDFSQEFIDEFKNDRIYLEEEFMRKKLKLLCELANDYHFEDLYCYDTGILFILHTTEKEHSTIRYRIKVYVKLLAVKFTQTNQIVHFIIDHLQLKSLNFISKPFRHCAERRARRMLIDEFERVCEENKILYQRYNTHTTDIKDTTTTANNNVNAEYWIDLKNLKELNLLRQQHFLLGNRSILEIIEILNIEHQNGAIILAYRIRMPTAIDKTSSLSTSSPSPFIISEVDLSRKRATRQIIRRS
ncbi:unnamed protein product [Didymodactylos carnosus]|uniref:Uncharacterized protein n=1 Tax=Didymodactylos carnosus TaxID=1234261 RepID=A0A814NEP7_9BILA|nr:unnamed protein product [Didymodactylos carnosus]CAF3856480.1 unnamed protein product [Didymodactylos carnosus]